MASNMLLNIVIGATLGGGFQSAFATANSTVSRLGEQSNRLQAHHERLGSLMARSMTRPHTDLGRMQQQYQRVGQAIERTRQAQERLNRSLERQHRLSNDRQELRSQAKETIGTAVALSAPFVAGAKASIEFESAMAEVNKTVNFASQDGLKKLGDGIKQLSLEIPLPAKELANIASSGGQLGVAEKDLLGFTKTVAKMGVAFDMSADQAGESMAKLANVYKIPIANISQVGDAINTLSNSSPAKAREIVDTLGRVGGLSQQFGLSVNQATALSSTFISLGKSPEVAGTAINGLITTLSTLDPSNKKQAGAFKQMGIDIGEFSKLAKTDGQQAIMTLLQGIDKLPKSDRIGVLTGLFGKEYADDIAALSGGLATYKQQLQTLQAVDKNGKPQYIGSMNREFASISGTTANKMALFKNNITLLGMAIGDALIPSLNEAIRAMVPLVQKFTAFSQAHPHLIKNLFLLGAGLFAGKMGVIGLRYGFNLLSAGLNTVGIAINVFRGKLSLLRGAMALGFRPQGILRFISALRGLNVMGRMVGLATRFASGIRLIGTAFQALRIILMANPLGVAIGLLIVAAVLIYRNWSPIKAFFINLWNSIKATATSAMNAITNIIANFHPITYFSNAFNAVMGYLGGLPARFAQFGTNIIQGLINGITAKFGELKAKMSAMANEISSSFKGALGIRSPSRVFMGFGRNIAEGVAIGIHGQTPQAIKASDNMAKRLAQTEYSNKILGRQSVSGGMSAGTVHFSPTIHVNGGSGDVSGQVQQGLQAGYREFLAMLERAERDRGRRAFA